MMPGQPGYVDLEQRAYGPDSAPEECDAIADRVSLLEERVLLMREMPVQSPFSINLMFDRLEALARDWDRRGADGGNTLSDGVHTV